MFIVWANLDAEARWGNQTLPKHVLEKISAAAVTLAAFAPDGEPVELWTPAPVDASRVKLDSVTLRTGVPARQDLVWAAPDAKAANDRRVALEIHDKLGTLLPGQRVITSIDELAAVTGPWVAKAPWTAAGRDRAHGDGPPTGERAVHITRMIERFGALLFEPWCTRLFDTGVCGALDVSGNATMHAPHTLRSDPRGNFVGISLARPELTAAESAQLDRYVEEAGRALHALEYTGPFGVDAFVYSTPDGGRVLHACEINARHTFGHVAHALRDRFGATALGFGAPPPGARVLVEGSAWIHG